METTLIPLTQERVHEILSTHFNYYQKLNSEEQEVFVKRVWDFIGIKDFVPKENVELAAGIDNIKTLISAAAIQLTFGLSKYELEHFSRIFIYPSAYYNNMTKHWHKGEANVVGALVFSWKDLEAGYADTTDKLNLGLHEMAHALMLSINVGEGNDPFFAQYFYKWWGISSEEFQKLEKHEASFFRDYGGTNPQEFFSVCVECFFEAPVEFKDKHPEIYRQTCILLNQDPSGNYATITEAREKLLSEKQVDVIPSVLQYATSGRTWTFTMYFVTAWAVFFIAAGLMGAIQALIVAGASVFLVAFIAWYALSHKEFSVYDNAFVVSYERFGRKAQGEIILSPESIISIAFVYDRDSTEESILQVMHVEGTQIRKDTWAFTHLKSADRAGLRKAMREFCAKNRITITGQ